MEGTEEREREEGEERDQRDQREERDHRDEVEERDQRKEGEERDQREEGECLGQSGIWTSLDGQLCQDMIAKYLDRLCIWVFGRLVSWLVSMLGT